MKNWYYAVNGEQKGPVDFTTIQNLYQSGQLKDEDLVWEEGTADWVKASTVVSKPAPSAIPVVPATPFSPQPFPSGSASRPDYGDFLCWGVGLIIIPCVGLLAGIALVVLHILELIAVRKDVEEGKLQPSSYSNIHPVLMGFGLVCCSIIFYPLFMHWRNESGAFKRQPHAVWFAIAVFVLVIAVNIAFQFLSVLMNGASSFGH